jgi:hypothetical protein
MHRPSPHVLRTLGRLTVPVLVALWATAAGCGSVGQPEHRDDSRATHRAAVAVTRQEARVRRLRRAVAAERTRQRRRARRAITTAPLEPGPARGIFSSADRMSFERLAASLGGEHGLAASAAGLGQEPESVGSWRTGVAWSTSKVPIAMAVIERGADGAEQNDLRQAITASDNAAATRLWSSLGDPRGAASAANEQLRRAGDLGTELEYRTLRPGYTPFGQTPWALTDQVRFIAGLGCSTTGTRVLGLMGDVVASQRWGLGAAGVAAQLKGGWGPGVRPGASGGYLDRQMGVLRIEGRPLAVAIATAPADGSHDSGTRNLTAIARWVVARADVGALPKWPRCPASSAG